MKMKMKNLVSGSSAGSNFEEGEILIEKSLCDCTDCTELNSGVKSKV